MKLKDLYTPKKSSQGPTTNGWHQIESKLRCDMEYKLGQVCGITKPAILTPDPLAKGSLFHVGRAGWFTRKFKTDAKTINAIFAEMEKARDEAPLPYSQAALTEAKSYVQQYIDYWSVRPLPKPVGVEYDLGPVPFRKDDPWWLNRTARLDDVSYYPGAPGNGLCIGECKTTSVGVDDAENEYTLHGQLLTQFMLWKMAPQGEAKHGPIGYVMLDVIKKGYGAEKCTFGRVPVQVTEFSLKWFVASMNYHLNQAALINENTPVPRNPKQCTRQVGRMRVPCTFRDICKFGQATGYVDAKGQSVAKKYEGYKVKPWE